MRGKEGGCEIRGDEKISVWGIGGSNVGKIWKGKEWRNFLETGRVRGKEEGTKGIVGKGVYERVDREGK